MIGCMTPLLIAVACQAFYTVLAQRSAMLGGLEEKGRSLGELMVDVVGPSLALDDPHGVQEGLGYVRKDADFAFAATLTSAGQVVAYQGPEASRETFMSMVSLVTAPRSLSAHDVQVTLYPLKPGTTELGTVAIGLKTANAHAAVTRMVIRTVLIASLGILIALTVVLLLASAVVRRNQDLKRIMDNVGQGLLTVRQNAELLPEHSAILETWFGPWKASQPFWSYIGAGAPAVRETLETMWTNVTEDNLPIEVSLDQLPSRIVVANRTFDMCYRPIMKGEQLTHILIVMSDVTVQVEQERATIQQRELVSLFQWLIKDRQGLLDFFADNNRIVHQICSSTPKDPVTLKRDVHTLKGNCGVFNLVSVVAVCQTIEDHFEEDGAELRALDVEQLKESWTSVDQRLRQLGLFEATGRLEIEAAEYQAILTAIGQGFPHSDLHEMALRWTLDPVKQRLSRLGEQAIALAQRMKRGNVVVRVNASSIRLPGTALAPFWNAAGHLIRNAIDHGLEESPARIEAGKTAAGLIELRATIHGDVLVVEIEDDGRGIAWDKVAAKARALGLPSESRADLVDALFSEGVTTRDSVSEISGRGVGLSAVRAACLETGGTIRVWSKPGHGTRFEFSWPAASLLDGRIMHSVATPSSESEAARRDLDGPWGNSVPPAPGAADASTNTFATATGRSWRS
jgi:two-component system chemotaxis sensor kinase CheA